MKAHVFYAYLQYDVYFFFNLALFGLVCVDYSASQHLSFCYFECDRVFVCFMLYMLNFSRNLNRFSVEHTKVVFQL